MHITHLPAVWWRPPLRHITLFFTNRQLPGSLPQACSPPPSTFSLLDNPLNALFWWVTTHITLPVKHGRRGPGNLLTYLKFPPALQWLRLQSLTTPTRWLVQCGLAVQFVPPKLCVYFPQLATPKWNKKVQCVFACKNPERLWHELPVRWQVWKYLPGVLLLVCIACLL